MWTESEIDGYIRKNLKEGRYLHTLRVVKASGELAKIHGLDPKKARLAAYLHDCKKYMRENELREYLRSHPEGLRDANRPAEVLHGFAAALFAEIEAGISDLEILEAIKWHTTGTPGMCDLAKVVFLADMIEEDRDFKGIEALRKAAVKNLDAAMLMGLDLSLSYLLKSGKFIDPDTLDARNHFLELVRDKTSSNSKDNI
jgi:predicted HD superfamily hydrolase involved in NAD metabolism